MNNAGKAATGACLIILGTSLVPHEVDATVFTGNSAVIKKTHDRMPKDIRNMVDAVSIYKKDDGVLGWSDRGDVSMNGMYLPNMTDQHIRELYTHEVGHVIDYRSFTSKIKGPSIYRGSYRAGQLNYLKEAEYEAVGQGGLHTPLMKVKSNSHYTLKHADDMVVVMYDGRRHVVRYHATAYGKVIRTDGNVRYIAVYTNDLSKRIKSLRIYPSSGETSLSRDETFRMIHGRSGYSGGIHEVFANVSGRYLLYRGGFISRKTLDAKSPYIYPYMRAVERNKWKVDGNLRKLIKTEMTRAGLK